MATRTVLFRFVAVSASNKSTWTHNHAVPAALLNISAGTQPTPAYQQQFRETMVSAMRQYQDECNTRAADKCIACGKPSRTATLSPCSYLHLPTDPFINILVHPICGAPVCTRTANAMMQQVMADAQDPDVIANLKRCAVCGSSDQLQRCSKCKTTFYCGRECQKKDYKKHKTACAEMVERTKDLPV